MEIIKTDFEGVHIIKPKVFSDERGFFLESYRENIFKNAGLNYNFIQDNHSLSREPGTLRGLHFQRGPFAQTKLVRCIKGAIFDVVLDVNKKSKTFGLWRAFELTSENYLMLLVPKGFAHGFMTLSPNTEVMYKVDSYYSPENDRGVIWNDPELKISWPQELRVLSEKDGKLPLFKNADLS